MATEQEMAAAQAAAAAVPLNQQTIVVCDPAHCRRNLLVSIWEEEPGQLSWSRVASSFTVATAIACLIHVVWHNHAIPDVATLGGLGSWAVFPYAVNKITGMVQK